MGVEPSPFRVVDSTIGGDQRIKRLAFEMTGSTVSGDLNFLGPEARMGFGESPFIVADSQIGGTIKAHGPEQVMGVEPSPFRVIDSEVAGGLKVAFAAMTLAESDVLDDISIKNGGDTTLSDNDIIGNVKIMKVSDVTITGNTIDGNLNLKNISGSTTLDDNRISGKIIEKRK
jgi:hypothetical protein